MQGLNANAAFSLHTASCTSNASIRSIHSTSCRISGASSMLRIGVTEAMEKKHCYEARMGQVRGALLRVFDVQEVFEWVEVVVKREPEPQRRR